MAYPVKLPGFVYADSSSHNTGNLELKPISMNGHTKSRSGSVISNISNGTHNSSGILKNKVCYNSYGWKNLRATIYLVI